MQENPSKNTSVEKNEKFETILRYSKAVTEGALLKNWHAFWFVGTQFENWHVFGMLARLWHVVTLARLLACWHVKMKFWHTSDTLACMHVDHAGTHGTRFSKTPLNASVGKTFDPV